MIENKFTQSVSPDVPVDAADAKVFHESNLPEGVRALNLRVSQNLLHGDEQDEKWRTLSGIIGSGRVVVGTYPLGSGPGQLVKVVFSQVDLIGHEIREYSKVSPYAASLAPYRSAPSEAPVDPSFTPIRSSQATAPEPQEELLTMSEELDSTELVPQDGACGGDVLTLRIAAETLASEVGVNLVVPEVAGGKSTLLESMAEVKVIHVEGGGLVVSAKIDTGKLSWPDAVAQGTQDTYTHEERQSVKLGKGKVVNINGYPVSNNTMLLPDGREVVLWFAEVSKDAIPPTRYGLVKNAAEKTAQFAVANGATNKRIIPATEVNWSDAMPEIVDANPIIDGANQDIRFAVDYTGARASAITTLMMRGFSPVVETIEFGQKGPVMYWLTEKDGELPFAVTLTTPEAWLEPGESADLDF